MSADTELSRRRAVTCPHWRWLPGMLDTDGCRVVETARAGMRHADPGDLVGDMIGCGTTSEHDLPDLRDPATLGCLLALVREAHGRPLYVRPTLEGFSVVFSGASEAEALVLALESAP